MKKIAEGYDEVEVSKFVYDFDTDDFEIEEGPMTYYDWPYHSALLQRLESRDPDVYEHHTVEAYFLWEEGENALDYTDLPANTFACRSDPIPTIINAFRKLGLRPQYWYNASTAVLSDLNGNRLSWYDDEDEEEEPTVDYETVPTMKFVYDENHDEFRTGDEIQTYYDHPHHSELMEEMAETTGNWDMKDVHSGYLYLDHSPDNAITYERHSTFPGMVMTTIPPHQGIIDHLRGMGHPITHWYERQRYPGDVIVHEIPQELPKQSKVAEVNDFSLIKFVSLPDKFLIGENTHHAYLLSAEFGTNAFPSQTLAIGRAWLENGKIHGIGFDYGSPDSQQWAIEQLGEWARDHGYDYSDNMEEQIIGLANSPDDKTVSPMTRIREVVESIKHCGDYGQCYWNPQDGKVFWNMADSDGPPEYDSQDEIREKFLAIPEVKDVEFGDEQGPPGGWYQMASTPPTAFVYSNGHMYYGVDHYQIMDEHDAWDGGLYGRLHERPDGRYDLELYSDYDPDQTTDKLDEAMNILSKRWNIADVKYEPLISAEDMADAAQFFG